MSVEQEETDLLIHPPATSSSSVGNCLLTDEQEETIRWMMDRECSKSKENGIPCYGGILAEDAGFGKTRVICGLLKASPMYPCLIAMPRSVIKDEWPSTIRSITGVFPQIVESRWSPWEPKDIDKDDRHIVLVTHTVLKTHPDMFSGTVWGRFIIDEAHVIRNPDTVLHKVCLTIPARSRWAVTSTPLQNRESDVFSLARFVGMNSDSIDVVKDTILYRMHKVTHEFEQDISIQYIELSESERLLYDGVSNEWCKKTPKDDGQDETILDCVGTHHIYMRHVLRLRQAVTHASLVDPSCSSQSSSSRFDSVLSECRDMVMDGESAVIFCDWIEEMNLLEAFIMASDVGSEITVMRLQGSTSRDDRDELLYMLKQGLGLRGRPRCIILLCQIDCGNCGLNLQHNISRVIIMRPQWNPAKEFQAIRRVARRGQRERVVRVRRFVARGTIDEEMLEKQYAKIKLISDAIDDTVEKTLMVTLGT